MVIDFNFSKNSKKIKKSTILLTFSMKDFCKIKTSYILCLITFKSRIINRLMIRNQYMFIN
ncbi:hypothetical protein HMPREF0379_0733 [[Eubacterium] yurii subsp. margaretiae ATCC 43715]|nr:hypothetical protein HMPREF0379_0733 [[Eubacterium] yurii subsp. margaretiae ATCC 43715]